MRRITFLSLLAVIAALPHIEAAPVPKRTNPKPAVINAGSEDNIASVSDSIRTYAGIALRLNKKVSDLPIVCRHKAGEAWLQKNLRVERIARGSLVRIRFLDGTPAEQAAIINVVVDYVLKEDFGARRETEQDTVKRCRIAIKKLRSRGLITAEEAAKAEEKLKKREEYIRKLPALVEHAKAR